MVAVKDLVGKRKSSGGTFFILCRVILRFFQFVLAITVAGLYGVDLNNASKKGVYMDPKWVYAEVVAGLSAVTTVLYGLMWFMKSEKLFAWDWILFVLWTTLFGIFGRIFIPADPTPEQHGQMRMQHAVWVDLVNMILWLTTSLLATLMFWRGRGRREQTDSSKA